MLSDFEYWRVVQFNVCALNVIISSAGIILQNFDVIGTTVT
jgi:hypothetical protein